MWYAPSVRVDTAELERAKSIVRKAVDDYRAASQDGIPVVPLQEVIDAFGKGDRMIFENKIPKEPPSIPVKRQDGRVSPEVEALLRACKSGVLHPSYSDPTPEPPKYACRLTDGLRADVQKFYDETFWRVR